MLPNSECSRMHRRDIRSRLVRMLYEFHTEQNGKRSGSVHATYMLYGIRKTTQTNGHSQQDGDVHMTSSPPELESAVDDGPVITLSLVAEESLKGRVDSCALVTSGSRADLLIDVLSQYESVSSIHVYSLGTHPVKVRLFHSACGWLLIKNYCRIFIYLRRCRNPSLTCRQKTVQPTVNTLWDPFAIHMCGVESAKGQLPGPMWRYPRHLTRNQLP